MRSTGLRKTTFMHESIFDEDLVKHVQKTHTHTAPHSIPCMRCSLLNFCSILPTPQVKELGAVVYDCECLADDLGKIFEAYWFLGESKTIPAPWPSQYATAFNKDAPMQLPINGTDSKVYLSVRRPWCSECSEYKMSIQMFYSIATTNSNRNSF